MRPRSVPRRRRRGSTFPRLASARARRPSSNRAIRHHGSRLRRSGCSAFAGRLPERWRRPICGDGASRNFDGTHSLRFHPACFYRPNGSAETQRWPALIGVVTDLNGGVTGVHRTWLDPDLAAPDHGKAPIENPKRSLGDIWTHAVRFGVVDDVMAAGEGIETILSLRSALPALPMIAALSASHLAAVAFPPLLRRLYIASDADPAGRRAAAALGGPSSRGRDRGHRSASDAKRLQRRSDRNAAWTGFARPWVLNSRPGISAASCRCEGSREGRVGPAGRVRRTSDRRSHRLALFSESRASGLLQRASYAASKPGGQWLWPTIFRRRTRARARIARLSIARQNSRPPPSSATLRPFAWGSGCQPGSPARLSRL